jgi:hypothetical protein
MNRKAYMSILLALVFMAFAFLTGCSSGSSKTATGTTYVFYLSGSEASNGGPNFYTAAGAVTIDSAGNVTGGEEDYNDGFGFLDAPTPISSGTLTVDATGQGTLTLTVGDSNLGVSGVEALGVQFVNANHALITQFDLSATSSGSLDLQSATKASGNFAYAIAGIDSGGFPVGIGGVATVASGSMTGVFDVNDDGTVLTDQTLSTGTLTTPDTFGRGTITGTELAGTLAYYVVGAEVVRLISDDNTGALGIGSAYGQGTGTFSAASIGSSVFAISGGPNYGVIYVATGSFATDGVSVVTSGIGDVDEEGGVFSGETFTNGAYALASNGYGNVTIPAEVLGDVSLLGVYAVDPTLNLQDPNNTTGGGGALIVDLDSFLAGGTGVLIPQTDTTPGDFTGSSSGYAFGAQAYSNSTPEFDLAGVGTFTAGAFSGTGLLNDVYGYFGTAMPDAGVTFTGAPLADADEATTGRYALFGFNATPNPLVVTVVPGTPEDFDVVIYQAGGTQAYWLNEQGDTLWLGPIEQQGSLTGVPR